MIIEVLHDKLLIGCFVFGSWVHIVNFYEYLNVFWQVLDKQMALLDNVKGNLNIFYFEFLDVLARENRQFS